MKQGSKTKPVAPNINELISRSFKEEEASFFEAALLHLWIPLEYKLKEIIWINHGTWPEKLDPRIKEIKAICDDCEIAKIVVYSTKTIKNKIEANGNSLLTTYGLSHTVKDLRNKLVHEGYLLEKNEYHSCKKLIYQLSNYLDETQQA